MLRTLLLLSTATIAALAASQAQSQTAQMLDIDTRLETGATATLDRDSNLYRVSADVVDATPGNAYVLYLVTFNNPARCDRATFAHCDYTVDSNALGGDASIATTTVYLAGGVVDADGSARFNGRLERGAIGLIGREVLEGIGVYNMFGAEVQLVVRDKGPFGGDGGSTVNKYRQTTEYDFGCNVVSCRDVQIATFE